MNDLNPPSLEKTPSKPSAHSVPSAADFVYDPDARKIKSVPSKRKNRQPRLLWRSLAVSFLTCAIIGTYFGLRLLDVSHVFVKNTNAAPVDLQKKIDATTITTEAADRINILLLGVGDSTHAGSDLSDTILVLSVDPHTHNAAMIGIPRDLYVKISGYGYDKINAAHAIGEQKRQGGGPTLAKSVVSDTLGIPIHYFVRTDFTGLKKAVDRLGGVTITVESALSDPEYPCSNNERLSCGFSIKAGETKMNGELALKYARCRKGNCGNDFGRAKRQQQVLLAMREKALSIGTISSPQKISDLVGIVGDHIRTDISLDELKTLYDVLKQVDQSAVSTKVLDNSENNLVKTADIGGLSVVIPAAGNGDFSAIRAFVRQNFYDSHIVSENVPIELVNATGSSVKTTQLCDYLKSYRYNVISCTTAPLSAHSTISASAQDQMRYTLQYLQKRFNLGAVEKLDGTDSSVKKIRLVIGTDYKGPQTSQ